MPTDKNEKSRSEPGQKVENFTVKVNGKSIYVPKTMPDPLTGRPVPTTMLQACRLAGVEVPHYCYHPKLPVAGNCRMCLVEFGMPVLGPDRQPILKEDGSPQVRKMVMPYDPELPRGAIACASPVQPGMEIYTNTPGVQKMREAILESLLINHPLDCPICDQAGECKLQEYAVDYAKDRSRFAETKVHKAKQVDLGPRIMLDNERCILCTRCIRFTKDIVGDDALGILKRGGYSEIACFPGRPFDNNYTLNTADICPVGALTSKDFRFRMRVWFLNETPSVCTSCATGCNILIGSRQGRIYRYLPRENEAVNSCWMCDHGRLNYKWIGREDRLRQVQVRNGGKLEPTAWEAAMGELAERMRKVAPGELAIVASARQTNEELFLLQLLGRQFKATTDCVPRIGEGDHLLVHADKNPNSNGARLLELCTRKMGSRLQRIADGIAEGSVRALLVAGEDLSRQGWKTELLEKLDLLVVSDILPNAATAAAHFVLPGAAHAEKQGTFVNAKGRLQRFMPAFPPPGDTRPDWEIWNRLVREVVPEAGFDSFASLFRGMAEATPAFRGITWNQVGDLGIDVDIN